MDHDLPTLMPQSEERPGLAQATGPGRQITTLQWAMGIFCALLGAMMLVVPHQFSGPIWNPLRTYLPWVGGAYFIAGLALVGSPVLGASRFWVVATHFAAAATLLALLVNNVLLQTWGGVAIYVPLTLGTALAPFVAHSSRTGQRPAADYLALVYGLVCVSYGATMLFLPSLYSSPVYNPLRPYLWVYGAGFVVAGVALMVAQVHPRLPATLNWTAHLAVLVPALAYALAIPIPLLSWPGIFLFVGFPLLIASLPWMGARLGSIDPGSFSVRLAFLLALTAIVPLVVTVAIATSNQARPERDVAFGLLVVAILLSVIVGTLMARHLTSPLHALSWATSKLAHGDSTASLPRGGSSEIEGLVSNFGMMREALAARTAERERLLADVQRRAAEMDALFSSMVVGVAMYDAAGRMVLLNPAGEGMLGYTEEDRSLPLAERVAAMRMESLDGKTIGAEETPVGRALRSETVEGDTMRVHLRDGRSFWIWISAAPIMGRRDELLGVVATFADVTAQRQAQAEHEARVQAERALRIRNEFIAVAAHELKTPITSLRGFSQVIIKKVMKRGSVEQDQLVLALSRIDQQTRRLSALTEQLLNATRLDAGGLTFMPEETDVPALVERAIASARQIHPERTFQLRSRASLRALLDPLRMEQAVGNLLDNAVKFSPRGATVEVEVAQSEQGDVLLSVRDYGKGIAEGQRERVFDRYYQAHGERHYGGMGLGLYISREIVQMHGGAITCEEPDGQGALFVVRLPLGSKNERGNSDGVKTSERRA